MSTSIKGVVIHMGSYKKMESKRYIRKCCSHAQLPGLNYWSTKKNFERENKMIINIS